MARFTGEPGSRVSHYRLEALVGRGGMGTVYRATDLRSDTQVAIKVLHEHLTRGDEFRERFVGEAHNASLLTSPYTCRLIEFWEEDGQPFMAMEFIEGQTVRALLARGPLTTAQALELARQTAQALEEAHKKVHLIHRDIKPENLYVTPEGRVKVLDFGIARRPHDPRRTQTGAFIGTPTYSAPEAFTGASAVDHRADIYSLGATLFHMLAGGPPFEADSAYSLVRMHEQDPPPLERLAGQPEAAVEIVRRCLEKKPEDRYQDVEDLIASLAEALRARPREETAVVETQLGQTVVRLMPEPSAETEPPPPRPAPEEATRPAPRFEKTPAAVTMELRAMRAASRSSGSYVLTLRNTGGSDADVTLAAADRENTCRFLLPARAKVPAGGETDVPLRVLPRQRRWFGKRAERSFEVTSGGEAGGVPPTTTAGRFEELPFFSGWVGWASMGGGAGLASIGALLAMFLLLMGGGNGGEAVSGGTNEQPSCESLGVVSEQDVGDGVTETIAIDCVFVAETFSPEPAPPPDLSPVGVDFTVTYTGPDGCTVPRSNDIDFFGPDGPIPGGLFVFDEVTFAVYPLAAAEGIAASDVDVLPCEEPQIGRWYFFVDDSATRLILHHEGLAEVEIPLPPGDAVPRL